MQNKELEMEKQTIIYEIPEKLFSEDVFTFAVFLIGAGLAIASVVFELKKTRRLKRRMRYYSLERC